MESLRAELLRTLDKFLDMPFEQFVTYEPKTLAEKVTKDFINASASENESGANALAVWKVLTGTAKYDEGDSAEFADEN